MKKILVLLFLFIAFNAYADGLRIGYLSASNPEFSHFNESFLNGLYLGLSSEETVVVQNSSKGVRRALENLYLSGVDAVIGPFVPDEINRVEDDICNSGIVDILPFASPEHMCRGIFVYNYNPIKAAVQLAKTASHMDLGKMLVLYMYTDLSIAEKNAFLANYTSRSNLIYVKGFLKSKFYGGYIKSLFGIEKIKQKSSLTEKRVYKHSLNVDSVVIFAPQDDFISIANLLDYYSIDIKKLLSAGIVVNNGLLSLNSSILSKMLFITPYYLCSDNRENVMFVKQYESEYQRDPNLPAALGFDIGRLLKNGDRISLLNRIKQTADFNGLIGRLLFFDDDGYGVINYRLVDYEEIKKCRKIILSR